MFGAHHAAHTSRWGTVYVRSQYSSWGQFSGNREVNFKSYESRRHSSMLYCIHIFRVATSFVTSLHLWVSASDVSTLMLAKLHPSRAVSMKTQEVVSCTATVHLETSPSRRSHPTPAKKIYLQANGTTKNISRLYNSRTSCYTTDARTLPRNRFQLSSASIVNRSVLCSRKTTCVNANTLRGNETDHRDRSAQKQLLLHRKRKSSWQMETSSLEPVTRIDGGLLFILY